MNYSQNWPILTDIKVELIKSCPSTINHIYTRIVPTGYQDWINSHLVDKSDIINKTNIVTILSPKIITNNTINDYGFL